ncbi:MAG: hypothetical protein QM845_16665 [Verrucomicrobiota bacterium]|nr:hypothetical protein [Verrucomicrobiota bacterium]
MTRLAGFLAAGLALGTAGCDRDAIRVYQAPKDPAAAPAMAHETAAQSRPAWTAPAHWQEQAPGTMQVARFSVTSDAGRAEMTVSVLPGDGGGQAPNVNRWRGQMGLPAADESELAKLRIPIEVAEAEAYAVELVAETTHRRMIAAGIARNGRTWFYKLLGDDAVVARERDAFLEFVRTVRYAP